MQCERKIQKQTNKFREAIARKQRFGHNYIQILQDYIYCPRHEVTMGFSTVCTERVIQSRVPMVDLIGLCEDETGFSRNIYLAPYTSLQDKSLACNGAF